MPDALWSLPAAAVLAYVPHVWKLHVIHRSTKKGLAGYNLKNTRLGSEEAIKASTEGDLIARCASAHYNQLEGFPLLAAGVLACIATGETTVHTVSWAIVGLRVVYTFLYVNGTSNTMAQTRSLVWSGILVLTMYLMVAAAMARDRRGV